MFCLHCTTLLEDDDKGKFCCSGCEHAYGFIKGLNLEQYYEKKKAMGINLY